MLKELFKIQLIVVLIFVMNAVATRDLKLIDNGQKSSISMKVQKSIKEDESKKIAHNSEFIINPPRNILMNALKKSLN